jgi:glycosyltransferase involved in cell wall biosynthesis
MPSQADMKEILYTSGAPVRLEPYTHRVVGKVLSAAARRGYTVWLRVPDSPDELEGTHLMRLIREAGKELRIKKADVSDAGRPRPAAGSILFFAGSLDYWRYALRSPLRVRRYRKMFWVQGIESDESYLKHGSRLRRLLVTVCESLAMAACRVILCPSDAMMDALLRRYPFLGAKIFITLPNLADGNQGLEPEWDLWGFENSPGFALGYVGGLSVWQCFEETCRIVAEVQKKISSAWFLVLTGEQERAEKIVRKAGVQNFRLRSTRTEEASRYIRAFDLGFMLRRRHIVNQVACPMKWLEYWQCGVPLVTTDAVQIVTRAKGAEFNCRVDVDDVRAAAEKIATRASRPAAERRQVREEIVRLVERDWTWVRGMAAVEDMIQAVEHTPRSRRFRWYDRLRRDEHGAGRDRRSLEALRQWA